MTSFFVHWFPIQGVPVFVQSGIKHIHVIQTYDSARCTTSVPSNGTIPTDCMTFEWGCNARLN